MTNICNDIDPQNLHELSWNYAQDGKVAVDAATGTILHANPAMETLTGYSRAELTGMLVAMLHPEAERALVEAEFRKEMLLPAPHFDLRIQRKDGSLTPVAIWSSEKQELAGRTLVIGEFRDITAIFERERRLTAQNWALSAYAHAALALGGGHSTESLLLQNICEAITRESIYVLAWVGIAEEGPEKRIRVAASAGKAIGYLDGLDLSWSEHEAWGKAPTGICIRTNALQVTDDTQTSPAFALWRERARQFVIRSSVSIPLHVEGGWHGALIVYAATPNAFEAPEIGVLQHLAEQIVHAVHALDQGLALQAGEINLASLQKKLTDALSAMMAPMVAAMEMRDPYTAGHESRVATIAVAIGAKMGWPQEKLNGMRVAAEVHDIGKISIPPVIRRA